MFDSVYGPLYTGGVALMTRTQRQRYIYSHARASIPPRFYPVVTYPLATAPFYDY